MEFFQLLRISFEPWSMVDLLAASKLLAWAVHELGDGAPASRAGSLAGPERAANSSPSTRNHRPIATKPGVPYGGNGDDLVAQMAGVRESLGLPLPATSYDWVVSAERSTTETPILAACNPRLTFRDLSPTCGTRRTCAATTFRVRGATLPTNPYPAFGQTGDPARWGFTNTMGDTQDLFAERIDEQGQRYEFDGAWHELEVVREEIEVKGRAPEVLEVRSTRHGPIVNDVLGAPETPARAVVDRLQPLPHNQEPTPQRARTNTVRSSSRRPRAHAVPSSTCCGRTPTATWLPVRPPGAVPARWNAGPSAPAGLDPGLEWDGAVPRRAAQLVNPNWLVTANNRIVNNDYPHHMASEVVAGYRARRHRADARPAQP